MEEYGALRAEAGGFSGPSVLAFKTAFLPMQQLTSVLGFPSLVIMDVQLTADQKAFARHAIETGRIHHEDEVVQEALALWESRERTRLQILTTLDIAEASVARGEGRVITEQSMMDLAGEVKQRGRARFAAEQTSRS